MPVSSANAQPRHNLKHLSALFDQLELDHQQFSALHPEFSRAQIAAIAGCGIHTVNNWFCGRTRPNRTRCLRLGMAHYYLTQPQAAIALHQLLNVVQVAKSAPVLPTDSKVC